MTQGLTKLPRIPKTLEEALEIILELLKKIESLEEQINQNSKNSSIPPSQDRKKKKLHKKGSGRKPGGQLGHPAFHRKIVPPEEVTEFIDCKPAARCACGGEILLEQKTQNHQVFDIPRPAYEVKEYRIHKGPCVGCGLFQKGALPAGVSRKGFGVRAQGMISLLTSKYRLSKRLAREWFQDVYQMPICVGSISNVEQSVSHSLAQVHEEVRMAIQQAPVVHVDETSHKEKHQNGWAWIASTHYYTCFLLHRSRGKKVAQAVIGHLPGRIFVTDRKTFIEGL